MEPEAEVWKWIAGIFGTALLGILGLMTKAAMGRSSESGRSWAEDRGEIRTRLEHVEKELPDLRRGKHFLSNLEMGWPSLERDVKDLERRVSSLEQRVSEMERDLRRRS